MAPLSSRTNAQRPLPASRTLSSMIREYRDPKVRPVHGLQGNLHVHHETSPLLGSTQSPGHDSQDTPTTGGYEGDDDAEAQDTDQADSDGLYPPGCTWTSDRKPPPRADQFGRGKCPVWRRIHQIRRDIIHMIDDPYSLEQLKAPRINVTVVRPLVDKYYDVQDLSIVFCLLLNRIQFIREQTYVAHHQTVNLTRALLCELLAEKVLRRYNENNPGPLGLLKLANILVAFFEPFQGAPKEVIEENEAAATMIAEGRDRFERKLTALELAIVSESKSFLSSSGCQRVVDAIFRGKVVYSPSSFIDIIPDHWKRRPISLYDPRRAPLLNQYRLSVPQTRNWIEVAQFVVLLLLYCAVMGYRETYKTTTFTVIEGIFILYAAGWILDQIASILEHGWQVYTQNMWSFLDVTFSVLYCFYVVFRIHGLRCPDEAEAVMWSRRSLDVLSCAAPILVPRLAFNLMSENLLFLSLRAMMGDFLTLTALAVWCFAGFLLSLKWLHNGLHNTETIAKWMVFIWFGLDGTGIELAPSFHWLLGPVIMVMFAFLGNTLFLTILVSMLSNTFSLIASNPVQEIHYRKAVLTFMGVKSDAIFSYQPPFNLVAVLFLLPLKWILSPRLFHSLNVACVRVLNCPLLVLINLYERRVLWVSDRQRMHRPRKIDWKNPMGPRPMASLWWSQAFAFWDLSKFSVYGNVQTIFECEPPDQAIVTVSEDEAPPSRPEFKSKVSSFWKRNTLTSMASSVIRPTPKSMPDHRRPSDTRLTTNHGRPSLKSRRIRSAELNKVLEREFSDPGQDNPPSDGPGPSSPMDDKQQRLTQRVLSDIQRQVTSPTTGYSTGFDGGPSKDRQSSEDEDPPTVVVDDSFSAPPRRPQRKDSMADYDGSGGGLQEANARLSMLEGRMEKIEALLIRLVNDVDAVESDQIDPDDAAEQLRRDEARETKT